jgi:glycosyltransferase involved in cell wall biosynthesis
MFPSITIVICCHNSAKRLPETLRHIQAQVTHPSLIWEVVVVDNASTDSTTGVATQCWLESNEISLRVVKEPQLGLSYARKKGFATARYEIISFIDDDNWIAPDWVQTVAHIMKEHPEVGACGGRVEEVCETTPPGWFEKCKLYYAISPKHWMTGDVTYVREGLFGAGLSVRRLAWEGLEERSYPALTVDRQGSQLTSGGDTELCCALRLNGWSLWYDNRLLMKHYLPSSRLQWKYARRLYRAMGESSVPLNAYFLVTKPGRTGVLLVARKIRQSWLWQVAASVANVMLWMPHTYRVLAGRGEGDFAVLNLELEVGRLSVLLQGGRSEYVKRLRRAKKFVDYSHGQPLHKQLLRPVIEG